MHYKPSKNGKDSLNGIVSTEKQKQALYIANTERDDAIYRLEQVNIEYLKI